MRCPRRITPARSSAHSAGRQRFDLLSAQVGVFRAAPSARQRRDWTAAPLPAPSSVTTPLGIVSTMVSSSRRRSSMARLAAVNCAEELSASCRLVSRSRRHVVEGAHQFAHLSGGCQLHAMVVLAGRNLVHGVGQRLHRPRDLLGEKQRQPHAGEKHQHRDQQQQQEEHGADLRCAGGKAPSTRLRPGGCAQWSGSAPAAWAAPPPPSCPKRGRRHAQRVLLAVHAMHRLIVALRRGKQIGERAARAAATAAAGSPFRSFPEPGSQAGRAGLRRRLEAGKAVQVLVRRRPTKPPSSVMRCEPSTSCSAARSPVRRARGRNRLRLAPRIAGHVLRQFQHHARRVFAQLRGVRRKPAVDRPVHQHES